MWYVKWVTWRISFMPTSALTGRIVHPPRTSVTACKSKRSRCTTLLGSGQRKGEPRISEGKVVLHRSRHELCSMDEKHRITSRSQLRASSACSPLNVMLLASSEVGALRNGGAATSASWSRETISCEPQPISEVSSDVSAHFVKQTKAVIASNDHCGHITSFLCASIRHDDRACML